MGVLRYLHQGFKLTAEDARSGNNRALKHSTLNGHLGVVQYLCKGFGMSKADAHAVQGFIRSHMEIDKYMCGWLRGDVSPAPQTP